MIEHDELKRILDYNKDTGVFTWKVAINNRIKKDGSAGTLGKMGYKCISIYCKRYLAHRLAWFYITGEWPKGHMDHENHVRDDNRFCNLRVVTRTENNRNMLKSKRNTSGITGVNWDKNISRWRARIHVNKNIELGMYNCLLDAACARKSAENRYGYHKNHGGIIS